ncbi:MAG: Gfo/Idh/MocA family oxidoreductase [candidate division NC10 bacterium]|nr:Gfo/Idh/MocA family oxidoreductase [candidate division NC10 bacterium]
MPSLSSVRPIRLGIIGTGLAVKRLHWPVLRQMPDRFTIAGFANRTRATAEGFAAMADLSMDAYVADYQALLRRADIETVLVCVPIVQLLTITRDSLAAGKHVICEKPPGVDLSEARQFLALEAQYPGRRLMMTENFFYRDDLRLARARLDAGDIGHPRLLVEHWVEQMVPTPGEFSSTPWRYRDPAHRGGPLLDAGVHSVATMRLLGGDITRVSARTEWVNGTMQAPSALVMTFNLANQTSGNCVWGFVGTPAVDEVRNTRIYGTEGTLIVTRGQVRCVHADGTMEDDRIEPLDTGHYNMFLDFYDALVHGGSVVATVRQGVENMLVVLQAFASAETGAPQEVSALGVSPPTGGVPLWRPGGSGALFDGLPCQVRRVAL